MPLAFCSDADHPMPSSKRHGDLCLWWGWGGGGGCLLHSAVMLITPCQAPRGMEICVWGVGGGGKRSGSGCLLHSAVMLITPCQAPRGMEICVWGRGGGGKWTWMPLALCSDADHPLVKLQEAWRSVFGGGVGGKGSGHGCLALCSDADHPMPSSKRHGDLCLLEGGGEREVDVDASCTLRWC